MTPHKPCSTAANRGRTAWLLLALCLVGLGCSTLWAPAASAHAELVGTTPADGERLAEAPGEVVLEFTERVNLVRDGIRLLDADGAEVDGVRPRVAGSKVVVAMPPELATGGYVLSWRVISQDTHPVSGAFSFGVRAAAVETSGVGPHEEVTGRNPVVSGLRWVGFAGMGLMVGGAAFLLLCWPSGRALAPVRRLVWAGWGLLAAATVLAIPAQGTYVGGGGLGAAVSPDVLADVLGSQFGVLLSVRLGLLVLAFFVLRMVLNPQRAPGWGLAAPAAVLALGLAATFAGTGHSASGDWSELALVSDSVHLTAVSLWFGGLVFLAAYALRPRHVDGLGGGLVRFSWLATTVVATLVVTGLFQAWRTVGSFGALDTPYGWLLVVKVAVVAVVFAIGGLSRLAVRRARPATLRRTVPAEALLLVGVLAITSVLVLTPPAKQSAAGPVGGPQVTTLTLPSGDAVRVELTPGVTGVNNLHLAVTDSEGKHRHVEEITARASIPGRDVGPFAVEVHSSGMHLAGEVSLPFPGRWRFDLTVRISDLDAYVVSTTMRVGAHRR